jgi:hypothetical protein
MSSKCEDCGTTLSYGVCGNCNETEANEVIDMNWEINRVHNESYPDWTKD